MTLYCKKKFQKMIPWVKGQCMQGVSISDLDIQNGSPKDGDMIAISGEDTWLVSKKFFEENYEPVSYNMGWAIRMAKDGHKIARKGWNGKSTYVVYIAPKDECILGHFCMFTANKEWQPGWLASQADLLATDWCIVD